LFEHPSKGADFDFAMIRDDTTCRTAPKDNMATALANHHKTNPLKSADRFRTRNVR
jgi:hypothetical protein